MFFAFLTPSHNAPDKITNSLSQSLHELLNNFAINALPPMIALLTAPLTTAALMVTFARQVFISFMSSTRPFRPIALSPRTACLISRTSLAICSLNPCVSLSLINSLVHASARHTDDDRTHTRLGEPSGRGRRVVVCKSYRITTLQALLPYTKHCWSMTKHRLEQLHSMSH